MKPCFSLLAFLLFVCLAKAQTIIAGEYFLDTDPGFGNAISFSVTPSTDGNFPLNVNIASASIGFHKLYIRTKDSNGKWSHTVRKDIEVLPNMLMANVVAGEYFIDTDPGFGSATGFSVTAASDGSFPFNISVAGFAKGYHKLFIRTKDDNGKWSHTVRKDIEIYDAVPPFVITGGEYFFDTDPGIGNGVAFTFNPADTNVTKTFSLPIGCTDVSVTHQVYFRVKDSKGDWSATTTNSFLPKDVATATTVSNGLWSNPATWSGGTVPTAGTTVILNHNVTVDVNAACYLLRTNCKNLTVSAGKQLLITGP